MTKTGMKTANSLKTDGTAVDVVLMNVTISPVGLQVVGNCGSKVIASTTLTSGANTSGVSRTTSKWTLTTIKRGAGVVLVPASMTTTSTPPSEKMTVRSCHM